ncbi:MAG: nucleotide exchange factor GrpE, partial [Alphaproteobacteria bacterium]|nr:nucleotide exchange factor GrpE [Alphaproteobacteria bacterium]
KEFIFLTCECINTKFTLCIKCSYKIEGVSMKKENKINDEVADIKEDENVLKEEFEESVESEAENDIEDKLSMLDEENQKLKDDYLRAMAELENTKKRCVAEIEKNNKYAVSSFAKNLLGVADNLMRALSASENTTDDDCLALRKGVELTLNELNKVFDKFGIKAMEIIDTVFDPNYHQVVQEVEDKTKPAGTIIAELQKGYMINDRILREAMVVVTKGGI